MDKISYRAQAGKGRYDVQVNGTYRGFVVKNEETGLWQAWVYMPANRPNLAVGVPYTTRREAGDEVAIQWKSLAG